MEVRTSLLVADTHENLPFTIYCTCLKYYTSQMIVVSKCQGSCCPVMPSGSPVSPSYLLDLSWSRLLFFACHGLGSGHDFTTDLWPDKHLTFCSETKHHKLILENFSGLFPLSFTHSFLDTRFFHILIRNRQDPTALIFILN